jgi:hypothetical protein
MLRARIAGRARLFLALGISLATIPAVWACSCAPPPPPDQALKNAVAVFLGKVVDIEVDQANYKKTVTLDVERWWKGGDAGRIQVITSLDGASCGYGFQKDGRYLVYAHGRGNNEKLWGVSLCSRTANALQPQVAQDMKVLGEGAAPKK